MWKACPRKECDLDGSPRDNIQRANISMRTQHILPNAQNSQNWKGITVSNQTVLFIKVLLGPLFLPCSSRFRSFARLRCRPPSIRRFPCFRSSFSSFSIRRSSSSRTGCNCCAFLSILLLLQSNLVYGSKLSELCCFLAGKIFFWDAWLPTFALGTCRICVGARSASLQIRHFIVAWSGTRVADPDGVAFGDFGVLLVTTGVFDDPCLAHLLVWCLC